MPEFKLSKSRNKKIAEKWLQEEKDAESSIEPDDDKKHARLWQYTRKLNQKFREKRWEKEQEEDSHLNNDEWVFCWWWVIVIVVVLCLPLYWLLLAIGYF